MLGAARLCMARHGRGFGRADGRNWGSTPQRPRTARRGTARRGLARLGQARQGLARQGIDGERMAYIGVRVPDAHAGQGMARHGKAWLGTARLGRGYR